MGSPLGPTLANSFLCYHEKRWLDKRLEEFKPAFYWRYVDNIFVLFREKERFKLFLNYFNWCHENIKFISVIETNNKLSFLDIEISRDKNQFITSVYRKPAFSEVFLISIVASPRALIFRCYSVCCSMELFHRDIMQLFEKNGYDNKFFERCLQTFLNLLF